MQNSNAGMNPDAKISKIHARLKKHEACMKPAW